MPPLDVTLGNLARFDTYNPVLIGLSAAIALLAAYTALNFAGQVVTAQGYARRVWLAGGAVTMGTGLWSMHFIGVLAIPISIPVRYSLVWVCLSYLAAIAASSVAFYLISYPKTSLLQLLGGSFFMGLSIVTVHSVGIGAMRGPATVQYDGWLVALSGGIAIAISFVALWLGLQRREPETRCSLKLMGAVLLALAGLLTHPMAIAAVHLMAYVDRVTDTDAGPTLAQPLLVLIVGSFACVVLGLALLLSLEYKARKLARVNCSLAVEVARHEQIEAQLSQALADLQQTQAQLIHTEKMSNLGQLVAGVAHEINNPVSFIYNNFDHAEQYVQDLIQLMTLYETAYPEPEPEIQNYRKAIDVEFLAEDLPKLLASMRVGADRLHQIVLSLRTFSRADQTGLSQVDLHEGIESTLLILQSRLKPNADFPGIEVVKHYGDLPLVECYAGQLNQVFMNLLSNAVDALEEAHAKRSHGEDLPTITIATQRLDCDRVQIEVSDNGSGIPPHVQSQIFNAFFTTKPVGQGTGLGLSISYKIIVERHAGQLDCESHMGQGTTFRLILPIHQPDLDTANPVVTEWMTSSLVR